jgi:hypothetical protein
MEEHSMNTRHEQILRQWTRRTVIAICCAAMIGCQSFAPIGGAAPGLQEQIRAGTLFKVGERVRITTIDGKRYEFEVRSIDESTITGRQYQVEIDEIRQIERGRTSAGRTTLLVVGVLVVGVIIAAASALNGDLVEWNSSSGNSSQ